jgi:RNA polymerase sporulation-specific sigma factor
MNDYELIYLVQNHQDGIALEFLFEKYQLLIWKYIHQYDVPYYEQDDFFQEGLLMLHKAIMTFDESKNKTFTRYFELILKRRFWALLKKLPKYVIKEIPEIPGGYILEEEPIIIPDLKSKLELDIFEMHFLNGESIKNISKKTGYKPKQIYNAIYRIKEKLLSK